MVIVQMKEELKFTIMENGELFVMILGVPVMLLLFANNWGLKVMEWLIIGMLNLGKERVVSFWTTFLAVEMNQTYLTAPTMG